MALPQSNVKRRHLHRRKITVDGYIREDGLWDIEGHMSDEKTYDFDTKHRGEIKSGEFLHGMYLRITIDDDFTIHDAEAVTEYSPYRTCPAITKTYKQLIGLQIRPGFSSTCRQLFKGINGCTHLTELLGPIATTAFQTVFASKRQAMELIGQEMPPVDQAQLTKRPPHLNTCHALSVSGPVVQELYTPFYKEEGEEGDGGLKF